MNQRIPVQHPSNGAFPFGPEFQTKLLKVLMLDEAGDLVMDALQPQFFDSPESRWLFSEIKSYWTLYRSIPTWTVLKTRANSADPNVRPTLAPLLAYLEWLPVKEEEWIQREVLEWVKQHKFHAAFKQTSALWNQGQREDAMDTMAKAMDELQESAWRQVDRGWFFEELPKREFDRIHKDYAADAISTGIHDLDKILDGGLSPGELGLWIAYAKGGKSTQLLNHGAMAVRTGMKKVLHFVLEGSRALIENRYESWFSNELYGTVKKGGMAAKTYSLLFEEYSFYKRLLVIRGMTDQWSYSALDIESDVKDMRKHHGWIPQMLIVDYGDLVRGREGPYQADWMSQRDAIRDLKIIALKGYAVWTASQAQRPDTKNFDVTEHLLKASQISGGIDKVRVADFVGSLNATLQEQAEGRARLWAELYRDNESHKQINILTDLSRMKFGVGIPTGTSTVPLGGPSFGYKKP